MKGRPIVKCTMHKLGGAQISEVETAIDQQIPQRENKDYIINHVDWMPQVSINDGEVMPRPTVVFEGNWTSWFNFKLISSRLVTIVFAFKHEDGSYSTYFAGSECKVVFSFPLF